MDILNTYNISEIGNGSTTLVLAHGFGSDQTAWHHQIEALKPNYRLILFDYLGCGKSDISTYSPVEYTSLERYSEDVLKIYDHLGLTNTIFVGHSVSAMIGVLASLKRPEYFQKLVFVGASPRYLNDDGYAGGFTQSDLYNLYRAMADNYLEWATGFSQLAMRNHDRPELGKQFARTLSAMRPDIAQSTARVIFESDLRSYLPLIKHAVLILQSQNDIAVPLSVGNYLSSQISDNTLIELPSEGHFPHMSAPQAVTNAIRDFIERQNNK